MPFKWSNNRTVYSCTINSKINGTPIGVDLTISKLHSILAVANLLVHDNLWLCYYGQVNSVRLKWSVAPNFGQENTFGGTIYFADDGT